MGHSIYGGIRRGLIGLFIAVGLSSSAYSYIRYDPTKNSGTTWGFQLSSTSSDDYDITIAGITGSGITWDKTRYLCNVGFAFGGVLEPYVNFGLSSAKSGGDFGNATMYGAGLRITPWVGNWRFAFNFGYALSSGHKIQETYFLPFYGSITLKIEMDETNLFLTNAMGYQFGWLLPYVGSAFVTTKVEGPYTLNGITLVDIELENPDKFAFVVGSMIRPGKNFGIDIGVRFSSEREYHAGLFWSFGGSHAREEVIKDSAR